MGSVLLQAVRWSLIRECYKAHCCISSDPLEISEGMELIDLFEGIELMGVMAIGHTMAFFIKITNGYIPALRKKI